MKLVRFVLAVAAPALAVAPALADFNDKNPVTATVTGAKPVAVANFAAGAIAGANPMALGPYAVKLAVGGFVLPFFFLFNPGLNMQGGLVDVLTALFFGAAMVTFASFALHGLLGLRTIAWPLRLVLCACTIATIVPRIELQAGAAVLGALVLLGVRRLAKPAPPVPRGGT